MDKKQIIQLSGDPMTLVTKVEATKPKPPSDKALKEYDPECHDVLDDKIRKDKMVKKPSGLIAPDGKDIMNTEKEPVNRIAVPFQRIIVTRAAAFAAGGPIDLTASPKNDQETTMLDMVWKTWRDNKLQYKTKRILKHAMSETESAELWYSEKVDATYWGEIPGVTGLGRMRMKILAPSLGDKLYPMYSVTGDLTAFGRGYILEIDEKEVPHLDIYTAEAILRYRQGAEGWEALTPIPLPYKKIPIIYYNQGHTEWADVQWMITRVETLLSNYADTIDYNGSPILVVKGKVKGFMDKGERGKALAIEGDGGDVKYVTWEQAPEAVKLELETLVDLIYTCSQTPDISFKAMKGLGGTPSGVAFDRIFIDPNLKARDKQDDYLGEGVQRRVNFLKAAMAVIEPKVEPARYMTIEPKFSTFRIDDARERIDNAQAAEGVASLRTRVEMAGLVDDVEGEVKQIEEESRKSNTLDIFETAE